VIGYNIELINTPVLVHKPLFSGRILNPDLQSLIADSVSTKQAKPSQTLDAGGSGAGASGKSVSVIPVRGVLTNSESIYSILGFGSTYFSIRRDVERSLADPSVVAIVLDIDSPGGEAEGNFELTDFIYRQRGGKPIIAVADASALSGGYSIASAADFVFAPRVSSVGSVGVVYHHVDYSKANLEEGIVVTPIYAGEKKIFGHPDFPLSPGAYLEIKKTVDSVYSLFVSTVARNRGLSEEEVRATEAGVFSGEEAKAAGFIDSVIDKYLILSHLLSGGGLDELLQEKGQKMEKLGVQDVVANTPPKPRPPEEEVVEQSPPQPPGVSAEQVEKVAALSAEKVRKEVVAMQQLIDLSGLPNQSERLANAISDGVSLDQLRVELHKEVRQTRERPEAVASGHGLNDKPTTGKGSGEGKERLKKAMESVLQSRNMQIKAVRGF
jgi:signal peptide peptidase SppA